MITGAHMVIYSTDPEADRAFLRDVLGLPHVDAGEGWLIFALPPSELAVHPYEKNDVHEFFFITDDLKAFMTDMKKRKIPCGKPEEQGWGLLTRLSLPGGGKMGVYQPRHERPTA